MRVAQKARSSVYVGCPRVALSFPDGLGFEPELLLFDDLFHAQEFENLVGLGNTEMSGVQAFPICAFTGAKIIDAVVQSFACILYFNILETFCWDGADGDLESLGRIMFPICPGEILEEVEEAKAYVSPTSFASVLP